MRTISGQQPSRIHVNEFLNGKIPDFRAAIFCRGLIWGRAFCSRSVSRRPSAHSRPLSAADAPGMMKEAPNRLVVDYTH